MLPCDPGCHGVQYGAKQGGSYYLYVSSRFSNKLLAVNPDLNSDRDLSKNEIVGKVEDAPITSRMGGQGILSIPLIYNGWVQNLPAFWSSQLAPTQRNTIK